MGAGVRPGEFTPRSPRVVAARRLLRRRYRDESGLFLAEGPQAVREALARPGTVVGIFLTAEAGRRHEWLLAAAGSAGAQLWPVTEQGLAALTETVTPQGLVAQCRQVHHADLGPVLATWPRAPGTGPRLVAVLVGIADPGNAGTVLRTADAAGASAVVFPDGAVDPYNGKCVRASAGSLFHLSVIRGGSAAGTIELLRQAGLMILAADPRGPVDLDELAETGRLAGPTAWLFGSEAHGLPVAVAGLADGRVRVPIYGRADSLNLAAAAAVCLYASARAQRRQEPRP